MLNRPTMFFAATITLSIGMGCNFPSGNANNPQGRIFVGNRDGKVSVIEHTDGEHTLGEPITLSSGAGNMAYSAKNHIFVNMESANLVATLEPAGESATIKEFIGVGERPGQIYPDPEGSRVWILNDADPITGIDTATLPCSAASASSVSVIQDYDHKEEDEESGKLMATICVGRGKHKAAFSSPSQTVPSAPLRVFVSNFSDGTISVIDNNPASASYLNVTGTIDLCDPSKESGGVCDTNPTTQNGAGPAGVYLSLVSGKLYTNNENYGTVNVINPGSEVAVSVEKTLDVGFAGSMRMTPDGRFIFVWGTDDSNPEQMIGKLTVINVADDSLWPVDLPGLSPSTFEFTSDGTKVYVASSVGGVKRNVIQVFDTIGLPALTAIKEITVGSTAGGRSIGLFEHGGAASHLFVTNSSDGTVSVIDAKTDTLIDTIDIGGTPTGLLVFPIRAEVQQGSGGHH